MNLLKSMNKNEKGVTLIELLVVVVILGIIAAVAIPAVMSNQEEAYANSNTQNVNIVEEAIQRYMIDHGGASSIEQLQGGTDDALQFDRLTGKTDADGTPNASGDYGPYLQEEPTVYDPDTGEELTGDWEVDDNGKVTLPDS